MANHTFLYDDACPMCKGYTGVFTGLKWSDRKAFSSLKSGEWPELDIERGRHEIPLLDGKTGEVRYGLSAMTTVIGEALPPLKPLVKHRYLMALLKPLYWLVTYNRRVIAGTKPPAGGFDCAPDFHYGWRIAYVLLAVLLVGLIGPPNGVFLMGIGLFAVVSLGVRAERLDFLGSLLTVLLGSSLLAAILPQPLGVIAAYLFALWERWRRFT